MAKVGITRKAHDALSNPWASAAAVFIAILWTIPTFGLLVSCIYHTSGASKACAG